MKNLIRQIVIVATWACSALIVTGQELPTQYREPFAKSWPIRKAQFLQMKGYLSALPTRTATRPEAEFQLDFSNPSSYEKSLVPIREQLKEIHALPPPKAVANSTPRFELVGQDQVADIYRVWTEVFEGVEAYALYMVPRNLEGKAPVIIAAHGGGGCPEAICDLDTRVNYRSFGYEAAKRGYIVYAPGMLMRVSYADPPDPRVEGADRGELERLAAKRGLSTRALQVYQVIAGTKALLKARSETDADRIGMAGLSMGGGYTLTTAALWPEIKAAVCSGGLRSDAENASADEAQFRSFKVDENLSRARSAALICPRPLMVQVGEADTVNPLDQAKNAIPYAEACYKKLGISDRFEFNVHPDGHVFENGAIFRFFGAHLR